MARPARLVQRVRIIQRHNALALADEDARSRSHRRFIADDDARMRRQARSRAVGPIASSDGNPRLPSSQLTASPSRVQACASAGPAVPARSRTLGSRTPAPRSMVMSPAACCGLRRTLGKRVCGKLYRGFESHSLRQQVIDITETIVTSSICATFPTVSVFIRANSKLRARITPDSSD
jgi:hypothetical protein